MSPPRPGTYANVALFGAPGTTRALGACVGFRRGVGRRPCGRESRSIQGKMSMSKLLELMRKLGSDAALAAEYDKDPDGVMKRSGLSESEYKAMSEKDYTAIKRLTGLTDGKFATNHIVKAYED